jgi:hypothetical protein
MPQPSASARQAIAPSALPGGDAEARLDRLTGALPGSKRVTFCQVRETPRQASDAQ